MDKIKFLVIFALLSSAVFAQQPTLMSLQGKLINFSTGAKIISADLRINITDSDNNHVFNHSFSNAVSNGMFDLLLGSAHHLNLSYNENYNLSIYVGSSDTPVGGPYTFRGGQGQIGAGDIAETESYTFANVSVTGNFSIERNMSVDSGTFFVDAENNRVGVGTTAPQQKLVVIGTANITNGLNVTGGLRISELASCDTIDTDSEGNFYCGSDSGLAAAAVWGRENVSDYLGGADVNASLIKVENLSNVFEAAFDLGNLTNYFGDSGFNGSVLRVGNMSNIKESLWDWSNNASKVIDNGSIIVAGNLSTIFLERNTSLWNRSGNNIFNAEFGGNVGIGTDSPSEKLTVIGNMNLTGNLTPGENNTYSLGSPTNVWKDLYLGSASLFIGGKKLWNNLGTLEWDGNVNISGIIDSPHMDRVETNYVLIAFRASEAGSLSVQYIQDGIIDEFEDQTGVDADASQSESYDSDGDYYSRTGDSLGNFFTTNDTTGYNWSAGNFSNTTVQGNENITLKANGSGQYPNTTGTYTSQTFDAGSLASFDNLSWGWNNGPQSNWFGDGSDGDVTISSDTNLSVTVPNGNYDGDMVVMNYDSLTINSGATLTTNQSCRGMVIYVKGDAVINGTLTMTARGAYANPANNASSDGTIVGANGIRIGVFKSGETDTLAATEFNGTGAASIAAVANQPGINGTGKIFTIYREGATGGAGVTTDLVGNPGSNGSIGQSGGGGSGGNEGANGKYSGNGTAGTIFSGGSGGGAHGCADQPSAENGTMYGGKGGNASSENGGTCGGPAGGGAGNPGGFGVLGAENGTAGTGGLLILIVGGDLKGSGIISANGSKGGNALSGGTEYRTGGGGSGGGNILVLYGGSNSSFTGSIETKGGMGGDGTYKDGGKGGDGSVQLSQINPIPTNITIQTRTSNDDSSWTQWSDNHTNPSNLINSSVRYLQYKATLTTNDTSYTPYLEWVNISYIIPASSSMDLISTSTEATSEPTKSKVVVLMENVSSDVTVNTDIKVYVSLDDGANYEQVTLTDKGKYNSGGTVRILTGSETLTDRNDQTMRWNITTLNDKNIRIHGVAHSWE